MDKGGNAATEPSQEWLYVWGDVERVGGTERRMIELANELAKGGHRVISVVRTLNRGSAFLQLLHESSHEVIVVPSWFELARVITRLKLPVIWTFGLKQSIFMRVLKMLGLQRGTILMARNGLDYQWPSWYFKIDKLTQKFVGRYITNSLRVQEHLVARGISPGRVGYISSGISGDWLSERQSLFTLDFIMVGNHRPEKNHNKAVLAFLEADIDCTLKVFTDRGEDVRNVIEQYPFPTRSRVDVVEGHSVSRANYDAAGALLHPSLSESLPLTILEATARGCYVVAGETGDVARIVRPEVGVVVDGLKLERIVDGITQAYAKISATDYRRNFIDHKTTKQYAEELISQVAAIVSQPKSRRT